MPTVSPTPRRHRAPGWSSRAAASIEPAPIPDERPAADLQGARDLLEEALAGYRRVLGDDHPVTLTSMSSLAMIRWKLGDLQGARQLYEQALAGRQRVLGDDHPDTMTAMDSLTVVRSELRELWP